MADATEHLGGAQKEGNRSEARTDGPVRPLKASVRKRVDRHHEKRSGRTPFPPPLANGPTSAVGLANDSIRSRRSWQMLKPSLGPTLFALVISRSYRENRAHVTNTNIDQPRKNSSAAFARNAAKAAGRSVLACSRHITVVPASRHSRHLLTRRVVGTSNPYPRYVTNGVRRHR